MNDLLLNAFDFTDPLQGFVSEGSHLALSVDRWTLGIGALSPRGLADVRNPVWSPGLRLVIKSADGIGEPVFLRQKEFYPWSIVQEGTIDHPAPLRIVERFTCLQFNVYLWQIELIPVNEDPVELGISFEGQFSGKYGEIIFREENGGIFSSVHSQEGYDARPGQVEKLVPSWLLSCPELKLKISRPAPGYQISSEIFQLTTARKFNFQLEVENIPSETRHASRLPLKIKSDFDEAVLREKAKFTQIDLQLPRSGNCCRSRELRAAAILERCSYRSKNGVHPGVIASYCSITSWCSTAFFWDTATAMLGLLEFDRTKTEHALRSLFAFSRADGCCPTHSYEHQPGSTYYPQPPLVSRAVLRLWKKYQNLAFVKEALPALRGVFDWFAQTQDHDRDGLIEVRFSGQMADNSPQYDRYVAAVSGHTDLWNVYLPPIASTGLNSFLYRDARSLAALYRLCGEEAEAEAVMRKVAAIPEKLNQICWDDKTRFFQDFDHQFESFNRCRTLYGILPVWAGIPMPEERRRILLEENLLSPDRFFGAFPFPFVACDEPAYRPDGYWRGRVWPHTTLWMLETLWEQGYHAEADSAADRLIVMMNQSGQILENYFSRPECLGGGHGDYNWSAASFLYIVNRRYREIHE